MKISVILFISVLAYTTTFAQWGDNYIELSKSITTEELNITGFDKIDVSEDFKVYINFSDNEMVKIEANENLHDLIQVEKKGQTLKISTKSYSTANGKKSGVKERLVAYITARQLTQIRGNDDVEIELTDRLQSGKLSIQLDDDSTLNGHLDIQHLDVALDDDSALDITGSTRTMSVDADGDSIIEGLDFEVGQLDITLNEDSEVKLTVNGDIDLQANGDSYFYYRGDANFTRKRLRGDSEVRGY